MAETSTVARKECLAASCPNLQKVVEDLKGYRVDETESGVVADCLVKDGCSAEDYTNGGLSLDVLIANAGNLALRIKRGYK